MADLQNIQMAVLSTNQLVGHITGTCYISCYLYHKQNECFTDIQIRSLSGNEWSPIAATFNNKHTTLCYILELGN